MSRPTAPSTPIKRPSPRLPTKPSSPSSQSTTTPTTTSTPLQPISLLPTTLAATYTHIHTLLILTLYYLNFSALVADPITTLTRLAPQIALAQGIYITTCLPVAGENTAKFKKSAKNVSETAWSTRLSQTLLSLFLALLPATPLLTLLTLTLGAPLTSHLPQTSLFALHLSLLTTPALFYTHGVSGSAWRQIISGMAPMDEVVGAAVGGCVWAWVGAVPIPLDWDREWQKWPVTILVGAVGGGGGGRVLGWGVGREVGGMMGRWGGWRGEGESKRG